MKSTSKLVSLFVAGVAVGSLPYTLSIGKTVAQDTSRLKPKHVPVLPDNMAVDNGSLYLTYRGQILRMPTTSMP
jgi:hypothetical protein